MPPPSLCGRPGGGLRRRPRAGRAGVRGCPGTEGLAGGRVDPADGRQRGVGAARCAAGARRPAGVTSEPSSLLAVPLEGWVAFGKPLDSAYLCVRGSRHGCRAGAMLSRPRAVAGPCVFYLFYLCRVTA